MIHAPKSWNEISLTDLFYAYRKAKADCFFETSVRVAEKFLQFELGLGQNLSLLLTRLQAGELRQVLFEGLGDPAIFPKKVSVESSREDKAPAHSFFSDARRAFQNEKKRGLMPEFRMIGDFTVEVHVISALWVNLVGHKFDAQLGPSALASRLRRYRRDTSGTPRGDYHLEAIGSFEPYFEPYRQWRDSGLEAIKRSLLNEQGVVAITLDVGNFYHRVDPRFAVNPGFHAYAGIELSSFEILFTQAVVDALVLWSGQCATKVANFGCHGSTFGGLPIGLSVVRVLSNAILMYLDREIENSVLPIYYARYVDDVFLVLRDNANFESQNDIWHMLQLHIPSLLQEDAGGIALRLPEWAEETRLLFQPEKQKCFFLSGKSGLDLLENIASQIRDVSSERRLMPLPEQLDQTQSARALTATDSADEADSLRRADGLTLRRLGWSVLLRSVGVLARDLLPKDWSKERTRFYDFAHEHVIRPDKILEQLDRLPRLFSIAVSLSDWKPALKIWRETISAIYALQEATAGQKMKINGHVCDATPEEVWDSTRSQVRRFFREALFRSYPVEQDIPQSKGFHTLIADLDFETDQLVSLSLAARETDWARVPYKEHLRLYARRHAPSRVEEEVLYGRYQYEAEVRSFLERSSNWTDAQPCDRLPQALCERPFDSLLPFLFPTRPYTPEEIALYLPAECVLGDQVAAAHAWAEYTRAIRGVWVRSDLAEETVSSPPQNLAGNTSGGDASPHEPQCVIIQGRGSRFPVRIGITSFDTPDRTWALGASGTPDLSPKRYKAIAKIVNYALQEEKTPNYLVFPELSIPERWVYTISSKLREGGISLIGGLDYRHYANGLVDSSAVLVLDDNRLGYRTAIQIRQRKSQPAPGEDQKLVQSHGRHWNKPQTEPKPVYIHEDFHFSVLVCSELQNIAYRSQMQGHVDCIFVLSWNRDIETFSALVDSASLDVHSYIALSNNLRYGDSRVRSPAKESFLRDVCRVRGGVNDQLVVVEIDPRELRAQQSRTTRWPEKGDAYKPAPEGFVVSKRRYCTPS